MLALSVNVYQFVPDLLQDCACDGTSIDASRRPPRTMQFAHARMRESSSSSIPFSSNGAASSSRAPGFSKKMPSTRVSVHTRANQFALRASTEQETEGVQNNRFARPGFACKDIEPGDEFQIQFVNDGEVGDGDFC